MDKKMSRDIKGSIVAFILGLLLNGLGTIIMVVRELWQSYRYGFDIEINDVVRYSLVSSLGALLNLILWACLI